MRRLIKISIIALLISIKSYSQLKEKDSAHYLCDSLPLFEINECLGEVLSAIVQADSGNQKYPPDVFFYELNFEKKLATSSVFILPSRWRKVRTLDYTGVIREGNMMFLIRGNISSNPLFVFLHRKQKVSLASPNIYAYDKIDAQIELNMHKPSLDGIYSNCKGEKIELTVVVGKKLPGFEVLKKKL